MVTGEHAVVHGAPAIVSAIEQRVQVVLKRTDAAMLRITSEIAPSLTLPMDHLIAEGPYRFVIACVIACREHLKGGAEIDLRSEIDHTLGLGSSAAVTVATLAALMETAGNDLHHKALKIIRDIQGRGSGADLAASLCGGTVSYQVTGDGPADITPLPAPPQFSLCNVGYKTPTSEVLALVAAKREDDPDRIDAVFQDMGVVAAQTISVVNKEGWLSIGPHLDEFQTLMERLGVSDTALESTVAQAKATPGVIGAKISGSGLGDCVLAIGDVPDGFTPVAVSQKGVVFHDNA